MEKTKNKKFQFLIWTIFGIILFIGFGLAITTTLSNNEINTSRINIIGTGTTYQVPTKSINTTTIYVDAVNGKDGTGDGSQFNPYQTINKSISVLPDILLHNYVIQLAPGTYREEVDITNILGGYYDTLTIIGNDSNPNAYRITGANAGAETTPVRNIGIYIKGTTPLVYLEGVLIDYELASGIVVQHSQLELLNVNINQTGLIGVWIRDYSYISLPPYFHDGITDNNTISISPSNAYNSSSYGIYLLDNNQILGDSHATININNVGSGFYSNYGVLNGDLGDAVINIRRSSFLSGSVGFFCNHQCNIHDVVVNVTNFDVGAGGVNSYIDFDNGLSFTNVNVSIKSVGGSVIDVDTTTFTNVTTKYLSQLGGTFDATQESSAMKYIWDIPGVSAVNNTPSAIAWTLDTLSLLNASGTKLFSVRNNGTEKFVIDYSGNVGIGTSTPSQTLSVNGTVQIIPATLSTCTTATNHTLATNATGLYYCNSTQSWTLVVGG